MHDIRQMDSFSSRDRCLILFPVSSSVTEFPSYRMTLGYGSVRGTRLRGEFQLIGQINYRVKNPRLDNTGGRATGRR